MCIAIDLLFYYNTELIFNLLACYYMQHFS